ncbi:PI16 inhibitor, partial [Sitta europaea]|nr:PI16 inhibitor [Sitta europaea]
SPVSLSVLTLSSFQTWDTDLEVFAQSYAEKCIWGQNGGPGRENLFATASTLDVKLAIEEWNGERKFYDFTTSECFPGQMCDNYTQVVWAETARIGCGSSSCVRIEGIEAENAQLLVCHYYPPGNIKTKMPYRAGPSCTACPRSTVCVNNLCAPSLKRIFSNFMFSSFPSLSALDAERQEKKSYQRRVDPPKGGAPSSCLGLSLFLLPSAILVGLLL